jgi:hypothetical protein
MTWLDKSTATYSVIKRNDQAGKFLAAMARANNDEQLAVDFSSECKLKPEMRN